MEQGKNPGFTLAFVLIIGIVAMSSASVMIRWAQGAGTPSLIIAAYRLTIATLALTLPVVRQRAWTDYAKLQRREFAILSLSGVLLGLHFASWITSLDHTSVLSSVVLVTTTPLWISLVSPFLLGEKATKAAWGGMVIAMAGGIVISLSDIGGEQRTTLWGDALALGGAIFGAGYMIIGRRVRERLPLLSYLWLVYGIAALVLIVWAIAAGLPLVGYTSIALVWMVALGLIPQLVGHSAANYALRHLPASLVGITVLGEPIGSTILAIILLGEMPTPLQIIGALLILGGIALAMMRASAPPRDAAVIPPDL